MSYLIDQKAQRMNIALVSPWAISEDTVGGTERFTVDLATQLHKLGNQVKVFMLSGRSCSINGISYTSLNILGDHKVANEYDLRSFASDEEGQKFYTKWQDYLESNVDINEFDLVQLNSLLFINAWKNKPRILTIHTNPFEYELDWGRNRFDCVIHKIQNFLPDKTRLTAPSAYYAAHFSELFHKDVTTIPHAVDLNRLDNIPKQFDDASKITILLPSRLEFEQKRPQIVFQGVSLLPKELRKNIRVIASGKDSHYQDNCQKLNEIARFAGFESQFIKFGSMADAYALVDIVALPSKSESFGYAALEALSLGLPTILNNLPTFKEIGTGNNNAYFFEGSPEAFAACLKKVLQNPYRGSIDEAWRNRYDITLWGKVYQKLLKEVARK